MKQQFGFIILSIFLICSCNTNSDNDCIDQAYSEFITLEKDQRYCFPDGEELFVVSLNNEFCPCFAVCVWEGEMTIDMIWTIDGTEIEYLFHSSYNYPNDSLPNNLKLDFQNIVYEEDCTAGFPSPAIISAELIVNKD